MPRESSRATLEWNADAERLAAEIVAAHPDWTIVRLRSAVNRALAHNSKCRASESRIQRMRAKSSGYAPIAGGKRVAAEAKGAIGMIVAECDDTFVGFVLQGVLQACRDLDVRLVFATSDDDPERELRELESMAPHVAGIVMIPVGKDRSKADAVLRTVRASNRPIVFLERSVIGVKESRIHTVKSDNKAGGELVAHHLISRLDLKRHPQRRIFVIRKDGSTGQVERLTGCLEALEGEGLAPRMTEFAVRPQQRSFDAFADAVRAAVRTIEVDVVAARHRGDLPCAGLFCTADNLALATLHVLGERQIKVPEEVLVAGFDDLFAAPAVHLTTVRQDFHGLGRAGVQRVKALIDARKSGGSEWVEDLRKALKDTGPVALPPDALQQRRTTETR